MRWLRSKGEEVVGWDLPEHDVSDIERTIDGIHAVNPQVIYHLAAMTDVDGCETDKARATAVNFQGTWAMALGAAETGCKLLYVSTDYVFDGRSPRPYRENDAPNPLSVYGRTKLMGEKTVERTCRKRFIVRTSWLYGLHGKNFVETIRHLAGERERLEVVDDQVGSPTCAIDLCRPLHEIGASEKHGTYHLTNAGQCSWYEFAREIVRLTGAKCEVVPVDTAHIGRPAPRPAFSVLENRNFKRKFGYQLRPWPEALKEYLAGTQPTEARG